MYCIHCGENLPEGAQFCRSCGRPQTGAAAGRSARRRPRRYEFCTVRCEEAGTGGLFSGPTTRFYAEARGPHGRYRAGVSDRLLAEFVYESGLVWPSATDDEIEEALAGLEAILLEDGWEPFGDRGRFTWERQYRRPVD